MSGTIKELTLHYDPVNEQNTFTNGDAVEGRVFLEVSKEANISCFYIKCKGDADVWWTESNGDDNDSYSSHERYFKLKQVFIQDPSKPAQNEPNVILVTGETYGNVVKPGRHVFPFSFQLPDGNFPPSFKGHHGSVKYVLQVTLERSWKMDCTAKAEINFVPKIGASGPLMNPQSGATDKNMKLFTSGSVSLRATVDRMAYALGDVIRVSTNIDNSSSRKLKLKYSLEQKQIFLAQGNSTRSSRTIFKVVGDPVPIGTKQIVNTDLQIPANLELTIDCGIIKVEYVLKVYLDVPYARDPEIKFPVFILSAGQSIAPWPSQSNFQPYGPNPPPQPAFGPSPPGAAFGPPAGLYPSLNPSPSYPQPIDPEDPPPSYTDIYGSGSPPPYPAMDYPDLSTPHHHPAGAGNAAGDRSNSANPTNQIESHPSDMPENIYYRTRF
ncbi:arrestin domain-containing protein 3-like [Salminus brasiliensis]|uniref:arrestin domain-containing protein 3-like n=1 Tax=Salminus brasiliensis TaxID=930266 RepID=UPI003B8310C9